jgi:imidazole glycerol-phosphate synthase subunit HisH
MITIINYGLGNIRAFINVYERLNIKINIANTKQEIKNATRLILPGVGAFDHAMSQLNHSGMRDVLDEQVMMHHVPVIGICVGMQIMAKFSEEGKSSGLGWLDAEVKHIDTTKIPYKTHLPHMGWNSINIERKTNLFDQLGEQSKFYFLHSYCFHCNQHDDIIAKTEYGIQFASAVNRGNVYGIQFHPEKSHQNGIKLLRNFEKI